MLWGADFSPPCIPDEGSQKDAKREEEEKRGQPYVIYLHSLHSRREFAKRSKIEASLT